MTAIAPAGHNDRFDVARVRRDFPALQQEVHGKRLAYLDTAASAMKPMSVIEAVSEVYARDYSNVHRGAHYLSEKATERFEVTREKVRAFINAPHEREVIFTRGATEGINLLANTMSRGGFLKAGDEVVITELEHHANIVPWHLMKKDFGIELKVARVADDGSISADAVESLLTERTKLVSVAHVSNTLGTVLPVAEITRRA